MLDDPTLPLYMRNYIYTLVVASVFINQLIGPPLFKIAIRHSGEAFADRIGGARLVAVAGDASQIEVKTLSWERRMGPGGSHVAQVVRVESFMRWCESCRKSSCSRSWARPTAAGGAAGPSPSVLMLEDDAANFEACQLMRTLYGVERTILHQVDRSRQPERFTEVGAVVVNESSLVVGSLDQFLSSARAAE